MLKMVFLNIGVKNNHIYNVIFDLLRFIPEKFKKFAFLECIDLISPSVMGWSSFVELQLAM